MILIFTLKIILFLFLVFIFFQTLYKQVYRKAGKSIIRVWFSEGKWGLQNNLGQCAAGKLLGDSYKSTWFLILHIRCKTTHKRIFIPFDAVKKEEYRYLMMAMNVE